MTAKLTAIGGHTLRNPTGGFDFDIPMRTHCLVILRKHRAENRVHHTEDNGVGHRLDEQGLAWGEGEENAGGEEDEQNNGDNDVEIHVCSIAFKNIFPQKYIHVDGEKFPYPRPPSNPDQSAVISSSHSRPIGVLENPKYRTSPRNHQVPPKHAPRYAILS